jgi:hypothetical protein
VILLFGHLSTMKAFSNETSVNANDMNGETMSFARLVMLCKLRYTFL